MGGKFFYGNVADKSGNIFRYEKSPMATLCVSGLKVGQVAWLNFYPVVILNSSKPVLIKLFSIMFACSVTLCATVDLSAFVATF